MGASLLAKADARPDNAEVPNDSGSTPAAFRHFSFQLSNWVFSPKRSWVGFFQPVLSQLLIAKHVDSVLQGLRILEGDCTLLWFRRTGLVSFAKRWTVLRDFSCNALNKAVQHTSLPTGA